MSPASDSDPEPWKVKLVERTGAALFVGGAATLIVGTICAIVATVLWGVMLLPLGLPGLLVLPTGWRLMMHPADPQSAIVDAVIQLVSKRE